MYARSAASALPLICAFVLAGSLLPSRAPAGPYTDPGHLPDVVTAWPDSVEELVRGPRDIANPAGGLASFGSASAALGPAGSSTTDVVSLGDGGHATVAFEAGLHNGPGDDLVVFENGFVFPPGLFTELAYVEVASNGVDFARFPVIARNSLPVASFEPLDPTDYHGFAGRHEFGVGTGFDLADLSSHPLVANGSVDLLAIREVRIVDAIGDGSELDAAGRPIHDPYATPFESGGFDLEAVGAIHVVEPGLASALATGTTGIALAIPKRPRRHLLRRLRRGLAALSLRAMRRRLADGPALGSRARLAAAALILSAALSPAPARALTATFDDLGLGVNTFENGANLAGGYTSGGIFFENHYTPSFDAFSGFAASTATDATTPGFRNQFSNITGSGALGSSGFGIAYFEGRIVLPEPQIVSGAYFTNTTYAALSMRDGDFFSKKFGGATGSDPDYFRLLVEGIDAAGASTGVVPLLLADFRFADDALDYILDEWVFLDLAGLGSVRELRFGFESSDVGAFGINTPTYLAIDELVTIPEPGAALLLGLGLGVLARRRGVGR
jgi:Domain of unknown function (DUF4465)